MPSASPLNGPGTDSRAAGPSEQQEQLGSGRAPLAHLRQSEPIVLDGSDSDSDSPLPPFPPSTQYQRNNGMERAGTHDERPAKRPRVTQEAALRAQDQDLSKPTQAGLVARPLLTQRRLPASFGSGQHAAAVPQPHVNPTGMKPIAEGQLRRSPCGAHVMYTDSSAGQQLVAEAGGSGSHGAHVRHLESISELQQVLARAPASAFPMLVALQGVVKNARTGLQFIDAQQQPLREYSMAATITDGMSDAPVILSHTLLQEILGVGLLDLWKLLRDEGKEAVRQHLDRLKTFLASFRGVLHLHISHALSEPQVLECQELDP
eukprot:jgi/Botrbrau1/21540/Bobra.174_2s0043.1